uniref:Uncharacterized protein n=1 Tax=Setaria viridis TaxID=4556 RepID=A0A4V6DDS8_SETVI|nr:hypothetical protein SEVIR_1G329732v2 [Setaria viridis]
MQMRVGHINALLESRSQHAAGPDKPLHRSPEASAS